MATAYCIELVVKMTEAKYDQGMFDYLQQAAIPIVRSISLAKARTVLLMP